MPDNERHTTIETAVSHAREVLSLFIPEPLEKGIWGSPMGKTLLAKRIVAEIPDHQVYVEPFAGGAQVLFAKEPSEIEVVGDLDPDIAFAFKFAKDITPEQLASLRKKTWVGDKDHFKKLMDSEPKSDLDRFYRFAYLSRFSFNKLRRGTMPDKNVGVEARFIEKLEKLSPRLTNVKVRHSDYERVIKEFDGPDTFFFLDPPYAGYDADVRSGAGHREWDEERFGKILKEIRGKFLCTYGTRGDKNLFDGFHVRKWRHTSGVGTSHGHGPQNSTTIIATNYDPDRVKRFQVAVSKTIWGSPAGKKRLADRLAAMLPPHKTYVEPFAGSAAVLFAKEPAEVEVLCDADEEIAKAYRYIKKLTEEQFGKLRKMKWIGDEATFKQLIDKTPKDDVEALHRFLYLTHFSYGKLRGKSFSPSGDGVEARTVERLEAFAPRLKHVRIYDGDYLAVVKKYDSPNTVFYFDPPYVGHDVDVGEADFDEQRFYDALVALRGKFLLTYGIRGKLPELLKDSKFHVSRIRTRRSIRSMRNVGGSTLLTQLVVTNYKPVEKIIFSDDEWVIESWDEDCDEIEKTQPFGTFGGSHHYAKRLLTLIPEHKTYVEPFAGAAALLHAKEPSEKEVIADLDEDLVFMHRFIKSLDEKTLEALKQFDWTCTKASWKRVRDLVPENDSERFYKLAFIRGKGRDARPDATHPAGSAMGQTTNPEKYLEAGKRLKDVTILRQDYRKTIERFDTSDTFFFIDPPYPGEWFDKEAVIDLDEFVETLQTIQGKYIAVLNDSPENVTAFKKLGRIFRLKVSEASGTGGAKKASRLFCANYKIAKSEEIQLIDLDDDDDALDKAAWSRATINDLPDSAFLFIEPDGAKDGEGKTTPRSFRHFPYRDTDGNIDLPHLRNAIARIPQSVISGMTDEDRKELQDKARRILQDENERTSTSNKNLIIKDVSIIKGIDPSDERFVLGIVLEPDVVDAQGDIYSADEIRKAAHRFMEEYGGIGLMHRFRVNDQVKVLESYLAPCDFGLSTVTVSKGTWLLAVRIQSDELWDKVKSGELTGFSIGGSARRIPELETNEVAA